jgi:hypothetical protein
LYNFVKKVVNILSTIFKKRVNELFLNRIIRKNIIYFCSVILDFSISYRNPASKSLQSTEISLYLAFTNELNVAQKEKNID